MHAEKLLASWVPRFDDYQLAQARSFDKLSLEELEKKATSAYFLARYKLIRAMPYLGHLLYCIKPRQKIGHGTFSISKQLVLTFDPYFMLVLGSLDSGVHGYQAAVLYHEVLHLLIGFDRRTALIAKLGKNYSRAVTLAEELVINSQIQAYQITNEDFMLVPNAVLPSSFDLPPNQTMEWYALALVQKDLTKISIPMCCDEHEDETDDTVPPEVLNSILDATRVAVKKHGKHAGDFSQRTGSLKESKVNWRTQLRKLRSLFTRHVHGYSQMSYAKLHRRTLISGVVKPSYKDRQASITVILDTSGSMGLHTQIRDALSELRGMMHQLGLKSVSLIQVDAAVQVDAKETQVSELSSLIISGRGGTDFRPAFEYIDSLRVKPKVVVYLTDGAGEAPKAAPKGYQTIWLRVPSREGGVPAKWGTHIIIDS